MTANQYRAAMARLALNNREMGELLGYSKRASDSYAQGWRPVPETVVTLITIAEELGVPKVRRILGMDD